MNALPGAGEVDRKSVLAVPLVAKLLGIGILAGVGAAFAADNSAPSSFDVVNELWTMAKAAGILGTAILWFLLHREVRRGDTDRAELNRLRDERDAMHERSLTALVSLDSTMRDTAKIMSELIASNKSLVDWFKDRYRDPKG